MACSRPRPRCKKGLCRECGPVKPPKEKTSKSGKGKKTKED